MYKAKFGAERLAAIVPYVTSAAAGEGIALKFDGKVGNTLLSHQLIHVAAQHSEALQDRVMDGLFAAYFEANDDITDAAVLRRVGLAAGLDAAAVDLALGDDAVRAQTQQSLRESAAVGQHGVPYLVFTSVNAAGTQQHPLSGAQEPETIVKVLKALGVPTA
jgi:predicted DsbA family dithiol-disulfide isomerase